jgi:hypothetical protein
VKHFIAGVKRSTGEVKRLAANVKHLTDEKTRKVATFFTIVSN